MDAKIKELNLELSKALDAFVREVNSAIKASDCDDETIKLIEKIGRQTGYLFNDFQISLVEYLDSEKNQIK